MGRRTARAWRSTSSACPARGCWRCTTATTRALLDTLFATIDRPTIVIENKLLYGLRVGDAAPDGFALERTDEPFPTTRIRPECGADLTILCYGGMLADVEKALDPLFDAHEIACEVICPTQLYPLDPRPIIESVGRTGRLLSRRGGDRLCRLRGRGRGPDRRARPGRAATAPPPGSPEHPIPACGPLEKTLLPGPCTSRRPSWSLRA